MLSTFRHIYKEICDAGLIKKRYAGKPRDTVRSVALDLYVAHVSDATMYVGYSRNRNNDKQGKPLVAFTIIWLELFHGIYTKTIF
jgi:hypothetical protein